MRAQIFEARMCVIRVCGRCVNRPVEAVAAVFGVAGSKSRATFAGMQLQQLQFHTINHTLFQIVSHIKHTI